MTITIEIVLLRDVRCWLLRCHTFLIRPQSWRARRLRGLNLNRSALALKGYADSGSALSYVFSYVFGKLSNGFLKFSFPWACTNSIFKKLGG